MSYLKLIQSELAILSIRQRVITKLKRKLYMQCRANTKEYVLLASRLESIAIKKRELNKILRRIKSI